MKRRFTSHIMVSVLCVLMLVCVLTAYANDASQVDVQAGTSPETEPVDKKEASGEMEPNRENHQKRLAELKEKHGQNPNDDSITFDYAEKLYQLGDFAQSREVLGPLLFDEKRFPQATYLLAQIEYVNGNYTEAEVLYQRLINQFPEFREKAEGGLEFVYYQTNQFMKAQSLSNAYNSEFSVGEMMRAFGDRIPYQIEWMELDQAIIPFVTTDPLPVVQAEIGGRLYHLVIDTGAGETYLDDSLAASLGIEANGKHEGVFAGGTIAEFEFGILDSITFQGVKIESVPVSLLPSETMEAMSAVFNAELTLDGIVGIGILKQFLATVDYPAGQLILRPRGGQNAAWDESAIEVPFVLAATHLIMSKGEVNGKDVGVLMDSGLAVAETGILFTNNTIPYADISVISTIKQEGVGGGGMTEMEIGICNADTFKLGDLPESKNQLGLSGIFPETFYFHNDVGFFIDSVASHTFLKDYKWTMDFDSMKMLFNK